METERPRDASSRRRLRPVPADAVRTRIPAPTPGRGQPGDDVLLARALDAVARAVGDCPVEAVAAVVMNRLSRGEARSLPSVLAGLLADLGIGMPSASGAGDPRFGNLAFETRLRIARRALAGALDDPTGGALRCRHADGVAGHGSARIGALVFDL